MIGAPSTSPSAESFSHMAVCTYRGATAYTRTRRWTSSTASVRVRLSIPALAAL